mgnify:CR=1 FL=1
MPNCFSYLSCIKYILSSLLLVVTLAQTPANAEAVSYSTDLGEVLSSVEVSAYDITIFPNGKNLPEGKGSVMQGQRLYQSRCMMCHGEDGDEGPAARLRGSDGWFSFSDPLRILRIDKYPILLISVGSLWPYATSIFDYTRRAMPHYAPKSLSNDEVYALTAYILYLNDLIAEDTVLDKKTILDISMPGQQRSISAWHEIE